MSASFLLHHLVLASASRVPSRIALTYGNQHISYADLAAAIERCAGALCALPLERCDRVAVYLEKRAELVTTCFGAAAAGCTFVPVNPLLKPSQVAYILADCNVRALVTTKARLSVLARELPRCRDLRHVILVDGEPGESLPGVAFHDFARWLDGSSRTPHRVIDVDMTAIFYTSGSTGSPKGVVLSHRNMTVGARSVASYLENVETDALLAALPLSFDAGFSQLTTAFAVGARVALLNHLVPRDVLLALSRERITGLTAVPPLYIQLAQLQWPEGIDSHLRYFANTGGRMPLETLTQLRRHLPRSRPYLMYGLTEAFRSTYLPPTEVDKRPDSIGKAIPNAEILVLRADGTECAVDEPGELVHRGALVGLGYWNDVTRTAERYRVLPARIPGLVQPEIAVFSGDTVRRDAEGFLYFIGREDEMIKSSGYRISPTEVEDALYATQQVGEAAAFGVPHPRLGHAIVVVVTAPVGATVDVASLERSLRDRLPVYMVPTRIEVRDAPLPRNPNGKIDRRALASTLESYTPAAT